MKKEKNESGYKEEEIDTRYCYFFFFISLPVPPFLIVYTFTEQISTHTTDIHLMTEIT